MAEEADVVTDDAVAEAAANDLLHAAAHASTRGDIVEQEEKVYNTAPAFSVSKGALGVAVDAVRRCKLTLA